MLFFFHSATIDFQTSNMNKFTITLLASSICCLTSVATTPPGAPQIITIATIQNLKVKGHSGQEKQYKYFREPNAVVTKKGTLLVAFGPHHVKGKSDRAHQDILLRRSSDSGKTWTDITLIADHDMESIVPSALVYDQEKNRVMLVYNIFYNAPTSTDIVPKACRQFTIHSDDDGATWSKPREILPELNELCVFGGSNGFQVKHGPNKGRLIIPGGCWTIQWFYSDDHGASWSTGKFKNSGRREATGCETPDGILIMYHRGTGFATLENRSSDGGKTWSEQRTVAPNLWSQCNNSALSIRHNNENLILLAGPVGPANANKLALTQDAAKLVRGKEDSKQSARSNGAIFISKDNGQSFPHSVLVAPGWTFGYNALVLLPNGKIGLIFEGAKGNQNWTGITRDHNTGTALGIYMVTVDPGWLIKNSKQPEK